MDIAQRKAPLWYTATLSIRGKLGKSVEERLATSAEEVVEILKAEGLVWTTIQVVKGRNPGIGHANRKEPYVSEMYAMRGYLGDLNSWRPYASVTDYLAYLPNAAKESWAYFMHKYSHGLSVSEFPRFLACGTVTNSILTLPPEDVRDPNRWNDITLVVHEQLDFWKDRLNEALDKHNASESRWGVNARPHREFEERLRELEAFDEWNYQSLVEHILPGRKPDPLDLDNIRLYGLYNGVAISVAFCGDDHLRMDFWRRLLSMWDSPVDQRADVVKSFLDHHYRNGAKPEMFRDLVRGTIPKLRDMRIKEAKQGSSPFVHFTLHNTERWGPLADELDRWLLNSESGLTAK